MALVALVAALRFVADHDERLLLVISAFVLQVYVLASLWGAQVYLGAAYGFRQLTESVVLLAPGLALIMGRVHGKHFRLACGLAGLLIVWNLLLICQYRWGFVPADGGAGPTALLENALKLIRKKRLLLLGPVGMGPLLLALAWLIGSAKRVPAQMTARRLPLFNGWAGRWRAGLAGHASRRA
jgi:hypothetical protein